MCTGFSDGRTFKYSFGSVFDEFIVIELNTVYDAFLVKVDSSGNMQWIRQFGTSEYDKGQAVTVDLNNFVYVAGYLNSVYDSGNNEGRDIFLSKYSALGDRLWIVQENGGSAWGDQGRGLETGINNNIFLTGKTSGRFDENTNYGEDDVFIFRYDADGTKH